MLTVAIFIGYLGLSIISSFVLAVGIDRIGARLNLASGLFGMLAALAADSPEISAAIIALNGGHKDVSLAVILGSNIFNLAALLGLSAVLAGSVNIARSRLFLNGAAGGLIIVAVIALLLGSLDPWLTVAIVGIVFSAYIILVGLRPAGIRRFIKWDWLKIFLCAAVTTSPADQHEDLSKPRRRIELLMIVPALTTIIVASRGMVNSAISLAQDWNISQEIVGVLVLATLTGIPNAITAVRLALRDRGAAVTSETLNSNTFNLLAGICLPALVMRSTKPSPLAIYGVWWLLGMTLIAIAMMASGNV